MSQLRTSRKLAVLLLKSSTAELCGPSDTDVNRSRAMPTRRCAGADGPLFVAAITSSSISSPRLCHKDPKFSARDIGSAISNTASQRECHELSMLLGSLSCSKLENFEDKPGTRRWRWTGLNERSKRELLQRLESSKKKASAEIRR